MRSCRLRTRDQCFVEGSLKVECVAHTIPSQIFLADMDDISGVDSKKDAVIVNGNNWFVELKCALEDAFVANYLKVAYLELKVLGFCGSFQEFYVKGGIHGMLDTV